MLSLKTKITLIVGALSLLFLLITSTHIVENNRAGYYQVKQAAMTGKITTQLDPGWYLQMFGEIFTYKAVATVGFGDEKGEGSADIKPIPVIFNDGSKALISGLVRIKMPQTKEGLESLKAEFAGGYEHFIQSGVVPIVKNAIKLAANLRSAQDAYTTLALFQQAVDDQLRKGIYKTRSEVKQLTRASGDVEKIRLTEIVTDSLGNPVRISNRFEELGCEVTECMISIPDFDDLVEDMISKRKEEAMKTELAKQAAIRAQQDRLTSEEQGKADVMKVKYKMEETKMTAVVKAQMEKEVAELDAQKKLAVAKLNKKAAIEYKQEKILRGEGDAAYKRKVMLADGALAQKLKTYEAVQRIAWESIAKAGVNWVPQIVMGGAGKGGSSGANSMMDLLAIKAARDLGLEMGITKK